jgi:hypothetical protein
VVRRRGLGQVGIDAAPDALPLGLPDVEPLRMLAIPPLERSDVEVVCPRAVLLSSPPAVLPFNPRTVSTPGHSALRASKGLNVEPSSNPRAKTL